jgi:hypothetical protein
MRHCSHANHPDKLAYVQENWGSPQQNHVSGIQHGEGMKYTTTYPTRWSRVLTRLAAAMVPAVATQTHASTPQPRDDKVTFSLVSGSSPTPGGEMLLGLRYEIAAGWHTYWDGFNDTGLPASWTLSLPEGWKAGEAMWPAPKRYGMDNGIVDHVYFDEAVIVVPISVPADAKVGSSHTIAASSKWLVCEEACIPEKGDAALDVTVVEPSTQPESKPVQYPGPIKGAIARTIQQGWGALASYKQPPSATFADGALTIHVPGAQSLAFFPSSTCSPPEDLVEEGTSKSDRLRVRLKPQIGDALVVRGVVEVTQAAKEGTSQTSWHLIAVDSGALPTNAQPTNAAKAEPLTTPRPSP